MKGSKLELISSSVKSKVMSYGVGEQLLAIKMVSSLNKKECQLLKNQFQILQVLHHAHIIKAYKLKQITTPQGNSQLNQLRQSQIALVLQFANRGSLLNYIHKQNPSLKKIRQIITQIASALAYLHKKKIAHRDIKLENVLVFQEDSQIKVKISDFGLASIFQIKGDKITFNQFRGTQRYMAPQIYEARSNKLNKYEATKADSFSLGVLLFALVFKQFPFEQAVQTNSLYILIIQRNYEQFWKSHGMPLQMLKQPKDSQAFKKVFEQLTCYRPSERWSMQQVLQAQFLIKQL